MYTLKTLSIWSMPDLSETRQTSYGYVIYRPPSSTLPRNFLDDLGAILNSAATHPGESIICSDFNIHFGNTQSTAALNLSNVLDNTGFVQRYKCNVTSAKHVSGNILYPSSFLDNSIFCKSDISSNRSPCRRMRYRCVQVCTSET